MVEICGQEYHKLKERIKELEARDAERSKDEEQLKDTTEKLRFHSEIMLNMSEGVILTRTSDGTIVYTNPKFEAMFGYGPAELVGKNISIVNAPRHDKNPEETAREIQGALKKNGVWSGEVYNLKKDGTPFWCFASVSTFEHQEHGKVWVATHADITERKRAEEALKKSEERLRQFFENDPEYCFLVSPEGKILDINTSALTALGYRKEEIVGEPLLTTIYARSSQEKARELFVKWKITGRLQNEELKIITNNGDERTVLLSADAIKKADGSILHSISVQRDITERKRAEEALRESERRFRMIFDSAADGLIRVDQHGVLTDINPSLEEMTGYDRQEFIGKKIHALFKLMPPKIIDLILRRFAERMLGKDIKPYDIPIKRADGTLIEVEVHAHPIEENGKITGEIVALRDVTERKQAEKELRLSEEKYRVLVENSPIGLYYNDLEGRFLYGNKQAENMVGFKREELIGKNFLKLKLLDPRDIPKAAKLLALNNLGRPTGPDEFHLTKKDGSKITVEICTTVIDYHGEKAVLGMVNDITKLEEAKNEREQHARDLEFLSKTAMDFVEFAPDADIYKYIGEKVKELAGDFMIGVLSFDHKSKTLTAQSVLGLGKISKAALKIVGRDPQGMTFPISEEARKAFISGKTERVNKNLYEIMPGQVSESGARALERIYNFGYMYAVGLVWQGKLYGGINIFMRKGTELKNKEVIETLIRQASVVLQRRQIEKALRQSETKYRNVVEDMPALICRFLPNGTLTFVNNAYCRYFNRKYDELVGQSFYQFIPEESHQTVKAHLAGLDKNIPIISYEHQVKMPNGRTRWQRWTDRALVFDERGQAIEFQSIGVDITERRQAEERIALESDSQRVRAEIAKLSMMDLDEHEIINRSLILLGKLLRVSRVCLQVLHEDGKVAITDYEWIEKGIKPSLGTRFKLKEGGWITDTFMQGKVVKVDASRMENMPRIARIVMKLQGIKSFFGVPFYLFGKPMGFFSLDECSGERVWKDEEIALFKDAARLIELILERKQAERTIKQSQEKLLISERLASLGRIAAGVAHELNNPLTGVLGMAELMLEEVPKDSPLHEELEIIEESALRCKNIISNLLSFAQKRLPEFKKIDLRQSIDQSLRLMKKQITLKDIQVKIDIPKDLARVEADGGQLTQVFLNLINNSIEASKQKGDINIRARRDKGNNHVDLIFEDNGAGIEPEYLPHIFEPFFTTKDKQKGTGLGLSISYGIIQSHGGSIECQSRKGKGTTFALKIPVKQGGKEKPKKKTLNRRRRTGGPQSS
jgi:PAS domain S-box-containing protein